MHPGHSGLPDGVSARNLMDGNHSEELEIP